MADSLLGQTVGGYRITRLLKRTGMSMVYLARDDKLERDVVVKVMLPSHSNDEAFAARFHQEALATARLGHPNIIHIYDFGRRDDLYYMVMEYLPGGSLYDRLVKASTSGQRMDMAEALQIVSLMGEALDHAHRAGFVHRDVKPSNILFLQDGHPVLTDLGVVKAREGPQLTESQLSVGTPEYMSPEQGLGDPVDARSDIYALGVLLYELLGGRLPFRAETTWGLICKHLYEAPPPLQRLNQAVSPALRSVVEKALAKRPEDRFQTAREMVDALERAQATPTHRLYPPPPSPSSPNLVKGVPASGTDKSRHRKRSLEARTEVVVIAGRITPRPVPARYRSTTPGLLVLATSLLVGMVALTVSGSVKLGGTRPIPVAASPVTVPFAYVTLPVATRPPAAAQLATVRTAAPPATPAARPSLTVSHDVAASRVVISQVLPTVVLSVTEGGQVFLVPYFDPQERYGLYVPDNWSRTSDSLGISFEAPDRMARVLVHEMPADPDESGAEIAQRYVEGARALFQEIREVKSATGMVGELLAYEQQLEAEVLSVPVSVRLLAVNTGETGLIAVAAASTAYEPTYRLVLAAMLDSFRTSGLLLPPALQAAAAVVQSPQAPTIAPTFTQAQVATRVPPTTTRSAVQPTTASMSAQLPSPILVSPADNEIFSGQVTFSWRWDGPALDENQGFEVRIWKEDQTAHFGAAEPTNNTHLIVNVPAAYGVSQGGSGVYFWTVAVVQRSPYRSVGPEAAPLRVWVQMGGGGAGGGPTMPESPPVSP